MNAFHAYDVRGVYGVDFTRDDVYKIGFHLAQYLGAKQVLVGRDARPSSVEIHDYLTRGIMDAGVDVLDLGLATTPLVYYATAKHGYHASVQITASHNPKEYNGLKVSREGAMPVGYDSGLGEVERRVNTIPVDPVAKRGSISPLDIRAEYVQFLQSFLRDITNLNIGIDCSNGMAGLLIHDILPSTAQYGNSTQTGHSSNARCNTTTQSNGKDRGTRPNETTKLSTTGHRYFLYDTPDGTFPNHEANPLLPENTEDLRRLVQERGCDVGIIFDGDGDRVVFIDEKGQFIPPDLMLAVLGHNYAAQLKDKPQPILVDIRTSKAVQEHLAPMGGLVQTWRVGRAYMASRLKEIDGLFGGELAGHYYFRDFFYSDSGLLAAIQLLNVVADLKRAGQSLGQLIGQIKTYANTGEINFRIADKQAAMDAVKDHFMNQQQPEALFDYDGYRVEYPSWWFNIRPSNTEPLLRFLAEAKDPEFLAARVAETRKILAPFEQR